MRYNSSDSLFIWPIKVQSFDGTCHWKVNFCLVVLKFSFFQLFDIQITYIKTKAIYAPIFLLQSLLIWYSIRIVKTEIYWITVIKNVFRSWVILLFLDQLENKDQIENQKNDCLVNYIRCINQGIHKVLTWTCSIEVYKSSSYKSKSVTFARNSISEMEGNFSPSINTNPNNHVNLWKDSYVGAIFMAENSSSGVHTRHVYTRYHFVREHIVDDFIKIIFVKSCDNDTNLFTKNVNKATYTKHIYNFLGKIEDSYGWILEIGRVLDCITNLLMDRVSLVSLVLWSN